MPGPARRRKHDLKRRRTRADRCHEAETAWDVGDHSYVAYLRVDDVDAFHDRAVDAGAEILKPPTDEPWGMREFGVRSPDGHRGARQLSWARSTRAAKQPLDALWTCR